MNRKFTDKSVAAVFASHPKIIRERLLILRELIFEVAEATIEVGELTETLKWGDPSYLTEQTKSGSTVRLGWKKSIPDKYAMYFNCRTNLIATFKEIYGDVFTYDGNRAIVFGVFNFVPTDPLADCIAIALTYHL